MGRTSGTVVLAIVLGTIGACALQQAWSPPADADELARGGRLYDDWASETGAAPLTSAHPLYPADGAYAGNPGTTWRCKECHGWDYLGAAGAYGSGKHATGIVGIAGAAGRPVAEIEGLLAGPGHGFGERLSPADLRAVARFVSEGQVAMDAAIARATASAHGDATRGEPYYHTLCATCHGPEGRADEMPDIGKVARENPWETLHKVLNGQPAEPMPALRALDPAVARDVLAFCQTLPAE